MDQRHIPALLQPALSYLAVKKDGRYIDCTLGIGGHASAIIHQGGSVLGIDQDPAALVACQPLPGLVKVRSNFIHLSQVAATHSWVPVDGILLDLGLSSLQLDDPRRGFSFQVVGPLDMRLDTSLPHTAATLVNTLPADSLATLFKNYGQIPTAASLAHKILNSRPIASTLHLRQIAGKWSRQLFLALRIAVNDELNSLSTALPQALDILTSDGRLVVISFHSLEDKIVKDYFRQWATDGVGVILTPRPIVPNPQETKLNPRSKSAKLRAFKKL